MKRVLVSVAVAALVCATQAMAVTSVQNGQSTRGTQQLDLVGGINADSTGGVLTMSNGALNLTDVARDRDSWAILNGGQPIINDTLTVGSSFDFGGSASVTVGNFYSAESSLVISAGTYTRFALMWRVIPAAGDTTTKVVLAWQVRGHISNTADTSSTFAWSPRGWDITTPGTLGPFAMVDSTVAKTTSTIGTVALPTEFTTFFSPKWYSGTLTAYQAFAMPSGRMLPLIDQSGVWFWAPYVSVRVRCLRGASKPKVIAYLVGRP